MLLSMDGLMLFFVVLVLNFCIYVLKFVFVLLYFVVKVGVVKVVVIISVVERFNYFVNFI